MNPDEFDVKAKELRDLMDWDWEIFPSEAIAQALRKEYERGMEDAARCADGFMDYQIYDNGIVKCCGCGRDLAFQIRALKGYKSKSEMKRVECLKKAEKEKV